jgi:hypothetical protein
MGWVEMEEPVKILNGEEAGEVEFWRRVCRNSREGNWKLEIGNHTD